MFRFSLLHLEEPYYYTFNRDQNLNLIYICSIVNINVQCISVQNTVTRLSIFQGVLKMYTGRTK